MSFVHFVVIGLGNARLSDNLLIDGQSSHESG